MDTNLDFVSYHGVRGSSDRQNAACCTANIFQVVSFIGLFPSALYPTYRFKEIFGGAHRFFGVLRHLHPRNDVQCNAVLRLQRLQKGVPDVLLTLGEILGAPIGITSVAGNDRGERRQKKVGYVLVK